MARKLYLWSHYCFVAESEGITPGNAALETWVIFRSGVSGFLWALWTVTCRNFLCHGLQWLPFPFSDGTRCLLVTLIFWLYCTFTFKIIDGKGFIFDILLLFFVILLIHFFFHFWLGVFFILICLRFLSSFFLFLSIFFEYFSL